MARSFLGTVTSACRLVRSNRQRSGTASLVQAYHDVAWFDIPVNEFLFVHRRQTGSDLGRDFQRQLYLDPT
jgi:hypothetical protein